MCRETVTKYFDICSNVIIHWHGKRKEERDFKGKEWTERERERGRERGKRPIHDQVRSHDHEQTKQRERTPWPPHPTSPYIPLNTGVHWVWIFEWTRFIDIKSKHKKEYKQWGQKDDMDKRTKIAAIPAPYPQRIILHILRDDRLYKERSNT